MLRLLEKKIITIFSSKILLMWTSHIETSLYMIVHDKRNNFFTYQPKMMFWVLKRTTLMRCWFLLAPKQILTLVDKKITTRPNKKNMRVSGNGSGNFR